MTTGSGPWGDPVLRRFLVVQVLLDVQLWFPVWLVFLTGLGFDLALIGLVDGGFRTVVVVAEIPCGRLVDRLGGRRALMLVGMLTAAVHVAIATVGSVVHLVAAWGAWGVLWALASGVAPATLATLLDQRAPGAVRARAFGQARAASSLAVVASHLVAGALLGVAVRAPFLVTAGLGLVAAGLAHGLPRGLAPDAAHPIEPSGVLTTLRGRVDLRAAVAAAAVVLVMGWSIRIAMQPLLQELATPAGLLGVAYAAYSGMGVLGGLAAARLGHRSLPHGIVAGGVLMLAGVAGTAVAPRMGPWLFLPLLGFGFAAATTLAEVRVTDRSPVGSRATMLSVAGMLAGTGIILTRPALAWVIDVRDAATAHAVWTVAGAGLVAILVVLSRRTPGGIQATT